MIAGDVLQERPALMCLMLPDNGWGLHPEEGEIVPYRIGLLC